MHDPFIFFKYIRQEVVMVIIRDGKIIDNDKDVNVKGVR